MRYLPFLKGIYSIAPGLSALGKAEQEQDRLVFQIDDQYAAYLENKCDARNENIYKYYCEERLYERTIISVNKYLVTELLKEHPDQFVLQAGNGNYTLNNRLKEESVLWEEGWILTSTKPYLSLFDALCSQVQEDLAICQLEGNKDWISALHLCAPNHWAASDKIGHTFRAIHETVPGMEQVMPRYFNMLQSIVQKGPFTRFAWGISSDTRLNHHPEAPKSNSHDEWEGRAFENSANLYVRVERQNLIGFPEVNAFLFTIRTFFYPLASLSREESSALLSALESMSPESAAYKGLAGKIALLRKKLKT